MTAHRIAGYGAWSSPITSDFVVAETIGVADLGVVGGVIYWSEGGPTENGRNVRVRPRADGYIEDVTPPPWNVRTRVHEYGGASYVVAGDTVFFSSFADQRLHRLDPGGAARPFSTRADARYADGRFDARRNLLIPVREDHGGAGAEPVNTIVSLPLDEPARETVLVSGADFYAAPRPSPDGMRLAWIAWNHPDMPWTGSTLYLATMAGDGTLVDTKTVAGGPGISIMQPEWSPDGVLHYVSDETGWWNLYRLADAGPSAVLPMAAEFAAPLWNLGVSFYAFIGDGEIACALSENGIWSLGIVSKGGALRRLATPFQDCGFVNAIDGAIVCRAGAPQSPAAIVRVDTASGATSIVQPGTSLCANLAPYLARPELLMISGGSAGGYTTLAALAFRDVFRAGASYYGIADLEALARDTHKFESHYLDRLVGPYPRDRQLYIERSPIHAVEGFSVPVIFFQGEDDKVVPPNQAEMMVAALKRKQLPFGYFLFAGEQHGFRKAATIKRALDAELYFYAMTVLKSGLRF